MKISKTLVLLVLGSFMLLSACQTEQPEPLTPDQIAAIVASELDKSLATMNAADIITLTPTPVETEEVLATVTLTPTPVETEEVLATVTLTPIAETTSNTALTWNGVDGTLEFVHGDVEDTVYRRTPLTAGDHARICDVSFPKGGEGIEAFERMIAIVAAGGPVWELNVTGAETIACWGFLGTPEELTVWAKNPGHYQNFLQASQDEDGKRPSIDDIMILRFQYEGGKVFVEKEAPGVETGDIAGWFVSHFDLSFHEGETNANVPFTITR